MPGGIDVWSGLKKNRSLAGKLGFEWLCRIVTEEGYHRQETIKCFIAFGKIVLYDLLRRELGNELGRISGA